MRELEKHPAPPPLEGGLAAFDVFLSYSRADQEAARHLRARLQAAGLATFLDRDRLPAGQEWQPALERGIATSGAVAVLVGAAGLGTWQQREVQLALDRAAELDRQGRSFPVIPVILPGVSDPPGGFLKLRTWVDLRADPDDPGQLDLLLKGIRGQPVAGASLAEAICPYRGLLAFREEDAGLFFGRETEVARLVEKIRHEPLLTLIGRSGSGKSSVIQAGLIPALRRSADGRRWAVVTLRPGDAPLHALVRAFDPPPPDLAPLVATSRMEQQVELLRADSNLLAAHVRELLARAEERGTQRLLLYIDQWEELYTQGAQAPGDVDRFIDLLLRAARTSPCTLVLTVRADFYADLLRHDALAAAVPSGLVNLGPLDRADLARAISEPAAAVGLTVDAALLDTLLGAVAEDSGKLPLLEYALKETWQHSRRREPRDNRLSLDDYGVAGGIDGAIARRADELYAKLDEAGRTAARRLFVSLVTPGEGREDTRARVPLPNDAATAAVVRTFSGPEARLLVTGDHAIDAAGVRSRPVEISHETLIREWQPLKEWVTANREALRRRERVRDWMAAWEERDRDRSLLLPEGLALEEGRQLLEDHGDVLIDEVRPYIEESLAADKAEKEAAAARARAEQERELAAAHERELAAQRLAVEQRKRTRLALALSLFALVLAALAGWQWLEARRQALLALNEQARATEQAKIAGDESRRAEAEAFRAQAEQRRAEFNLRAAARAADGLVFDLAQQLRAVTGVSAETIRLILSRADKLLADLAPGDDAPAELRRTRYAALVEFVTTYLAQGDLEAAEAAAEQSREIIAKLAAADPGNAERQRDLSVSWDKLGDVRSAQGDLPGALAAFTEGKDIRDKLAAADTGNAKWQYDLSISWIKVGDVRSAQGDLPGALAAYTESKNIHDKLATADPGNAQWQRDLSVGWERLGDVRMAQGDLPAALQAYTESKSIRDKLATADPGNAEWQRDLSFSWNKLGDMRMAQSDLPGALQAFTDSKDIAAKLAAADPGNAEWQRNLYAVLWRVGNVKQSQGNPAEALISLQSGHDIIAKLAAVDPGNAGWQRDLSISWTKLGDVRSAQGDLPGALAAFTEGKNIADKLAAADPGNAQWQRDLSVSWARLGDVRVAQGDLAGALQVYKVVNGIVEKLAAADPGNTEWQFRLGISNAQIGDVMMAQGKLAEAMAAYQRWHDLVGKLASSDPGNAQWQRNLIVSHWKLADLLERISDRAGDAAGHWAQALATARVLAETSRLGPTDAHFVATLEQRLAAARAGPSPPP